MNAILPIAAAYPNRELQTSAVAGHRVAAGDPPFADMMRAAATPSAMKQTVSNRSAATVATRLPANRLVASLATRMSRQDEVSTAPASLASNGNSAITESNANAPSTQLSLDSSMRFAAADGAVASQPEVQVLSPDSPADVGEESSPVQSQGILPGTPQTVSLSPATGRKQPTPVKDATTSANGAGSSTLSPTTPILIAPVTSVAIPSPVAQVSAQPQSSSNAATRSTDAAKSGASRAVAPAVSSPTNMFGLPAPTSQVEGKAAASNLVEKTVGVSKDHVADVQSPVPLHEPHTTSDRQGANAPPATAANPPTPAATNQSDGHAGDPSTSQSALFATGTVTHGLTNGISNLAADADTSNAVGAIATNSSGAGSDPVKTAGDRDPTSTHGSDVTKGGSFAATVPTLATDAKNFSITHASLADSSLTLQNGAGPISAAGHSGTTGNLSPAATGFTASRATTLDAFTAIDSGASGERGVLLHAAAHQVAVGVSDPSLGWVEVRAERVSGQIAAALTANSTASHAALTSVLPTMATYLQEHQAGVHQVHVETSLGNSQAGPGSQGQASSQGQATTAAENRTVSGAATNHWNAPSAASAAIAMEPANSFVYEGHHFSIRA